MHDTTLELYNELLETNYDEYHYLSLAKKKKKVNRKYKPKKLFINGSDYSVWSKNEEDSTDEEK